MAELTGTNDVFMAKETRHRRWQKGLLATSFLIGAVFVASYFAPKTLEKDTQAIPAAPRIAQAYDKAPTRISLDAMHFLTQNAVTEAPTQAAAPATTPEITPTAPPTIPQMSNTQRAQQAFGTYNPAAEWPASTPEQLATDLANVNARLAQDSKPENGMVDSGALLVEKPIGTPQTAEQSVADHMLGLGRTAVDKTTDATSFLWNKTSEFTVDTWNSIFGGSEKTTQAAQESLEQSAPAPMATPTGPAADAVVAVADQTPAPAADKATALEQSYQWVTVDGVNMTKDAYTTVFGPVVAPETFGEQTRDVTNKVTDPMIDAGTEVRENLAKKMGASMGKPGEYTGHIIGAVPDAALTVVGAGGKVIGHTVGWAAHGVEKGWKWAFNTHDDVNMTVSAEQPTAVAQGQVGKEQPAKTAGLTDAIRQAQQPAATAAATTPTIDPTFNGVRFGEARVTKMLQEQLAQLKQEYNALYPNTPASTQTTQPATKEAQKDALIQKLMAQAQASQMQNDALSARLDSRDASKLVVRPNGR